MSQLAIKATGISKQYQISTRQKGAENLRDILTQSLTAPFKRAMRGLRGDANIETHTETLWALRDIDFDVQAGDTIGIIGRNGAGKSTLLKILSRITEPSSGTIDLYGRVGALLEVGTGFHLELTGRENIYLNGAILGMTRAEINRKFDEMIDFSGVERFIDTPVKRYSSGMILRLGFAVAAHLEPDILIVDEVLAVGDAEFQRKCLGKMQDVAGQGRTVLFVSHNLNAVLNLCKRGLYLKNGQVVASGTSQEVIQLYMSTVASIDLDAEHITDLTTHSGRHIGMKSILKSINLINENGESARYFNTGDTIQVDIGYDCGEERCDFITVGINSSMGERVFTLSTLYTPNAPFSFVGKKVIRAIIPQVDLAEGDYNLTLTMGKHAVGNIDTIDSAINFTITLNNYFQTGVVPSQGAGYWMKKSEWMLLE
ncbi:MAG: ABC transporter ATP-binding protein [Phototrophicales bacterium]|nr:ABC transporter ATP-binding protein [Phototrophicales bacterium]